MTATKRISIRELRKIVGRCAADKAKSKPIQVFPFRAGQHYSPPDFNITIAYNDLTRYYYLWFADNDNSCYWFPLKQAKFDLLVASIVLP